MGVDDFENKDAKDEMAMGDNEDLRVESERTKEREDEVSGE